MDLQGVHGEEGSNFSKNSLPVLHRYCTRVAIAPLSVEVAFLLIFRARQTPMCVGGVISSFAIDFRAGDYYWEKSESVYYCLP